MELKIRLSWKAIFRAISALLILFCSFGLAAQVPQFIGTAVDGIKSPLSSSSTAIYGFSTDGSFQTLYSNDPDLDNIGNPQWGLTRVNDEFWGLSYSSTTGLSTLFSFNPETNEFTKKGEFSIEAANTAMVLVDNQLWWGAGDPGYLYSYDLTTSTITAAHRFGGEAGSRPVALANIEGALWGLTSESLTRDGGTIFSYEPQNGSIQILKSFFSNYDQASLTYAYGRVYGTLDGRIARGSNFLGSFRTETGVVFSVELDGTGYQEKRTFLHLGSGESAAIPFGLTAHAGKLWGTLVHAKKGSLFMINADNNTLLDIEYPFEDLNGENPSSELIYYDGKLWGTARAGGGQNAGTIYSIDPVTIQAKTEHVFQSAVAGFPDFKGLQPIKLTPPRIVNPLPDLQVAEDGQLDNYDLRLVFEDLETGDEDLRFNLYISDTLMLPGDRLIDGNILDVSPYINRYGVNQVVVEAKDTHGLVARDTMVITVTPSPDRVKVTDAITSYGSRTTSGLVVTKSVSDGDEVSHFQVTDITNGSLFLNDGTTPVANGDFLSFDEGGKGLIFNPVRSGEGSFMVQPSLSVSADGLGSEKVKTTITVEKLRLVATADNIEVAVGDEIPELTFSYEGFLDGESEADITAPRLSTAASNASPVGAYPIVFSGGEAENYALSKVNGFVFVTTPGTNPDDVKLIKFVGTGTFVQKGTVIKEGAGVFALDEEGTTEVWLNSFDSANFIGQTRWGVTATEDRIWTATDAGGANDFGMLFRTRFDGSGYEVLHHFNDETGEPSSGLLLYNGYLWGSTKAGFGRNTGTIYRIKADGSDFEVIYEFSSGDGWEPHGLIEAEGKLWGMTKFGGVAGDGVIFSIGSNGQDFKKVFDFPKGFGKPEGVLLYHNGKLWGTAKSSKFNDPVSTTADDDFGSVFSIATDGTQYQRIVEFEGPVSGIEPANGRHPFGNLTLAEGKLWGMTAYGGVSSEPAGTLFSIDPEINTFKTEYSFSRSTDFGGYPKGDLLLHDGGLWGMTGGSAVSGATGGVFRFDLQTAEILYKAELRPGGAVIPELNGLAKIEVNKPLIANIPNVEIAENAPEQILDLGQYFARFFDKATGQRRYAFSEVSNQSLFGSALLTDGVFRFEPAAGKSGVSEITMTLSDENGEVSRGVFTLTVVPQIDGIEVSGDLTAAYRTLTEPKLFVTRHELDGEEVTHFKVTGIENTAIYLSDGRTQISEGAFVSFDLAAGGLRLKPLEVGEAKFSVQPASSNDNNSLGGEATPVAIQVTKADLYVRANDVTVIYGESIPPFTLEFEGFVEGEGQDDIELPAVSTIAVRGSDAGTYPIEVTGGTAANYEIIRQNGSLVIGKALLNVAADDVYVQYQQITAPAYSLTYDGFVLGEDESVLQSLPTVTGQSQDQVPGNYALTVSGGSATNYLINRIEGTQVIGLAATAEKGAIGDKDGIKGKFVLVGTSTFSNGTVFAIDKNLKNKSWQIFNSTTSGRIPFSGVVEAEEKVWGTTSTGGINGNGVIYTIATINRQFAKVHEFDFTNGAQPNSKLVLADDKLWGTTSQGGAFNQGIIYSINTDGTGFQNVYDFDGASGAFPSNGLTKVGEYLWGMTTYGGANQRGVIYRLKTDGSGFQVLHEFGVDKGIPFGDLTLANGKLWGMTRESPGPLEFFVVGSAEDNGAIFSIETNGTGYTEVHDFSREDNADIGLKGGRHPHGSLTLYNNELWGMTTYGGEFGNSNFGTIFKLDLSESSPQFEKVYDFKGDNSGKYPKGSLTVFEDALWGMTTEGGAFNLGMAFRFDPNAAINEYQSVLSFSGNGNGGNPFLGSFEKVFVRLIPTRIQRIPDFRQFEGVASMSVDLNTYFGDQDRQPADLKFTIDGMSNTSFIYKAEIVNDRLILLFRDNEIGQSTVRIKAEGEKGDFITDTFLVEIYEAPDVPDVVSARTVYGTFNSEGLVISKNKVDSEEVSHFQVSFIHNGRLFLNDGTTELRNGSIIEVAEGEKGLKFLPNSVSRGFFNIRATTKGDSTGVFSGIRTAIIDVDKAPLRITADDKVMFYGNNVPNLTMSFNGFVLGETLNDITLPDISTIATRFSDTNNYLIELSGGDARNYDIELVNGLLTVEKAPLQIVADTKNIRYGDEVPELTLSYTGLVNGDDLAEITLPTASTTANDDSEVGQYAIDLQGGSADDYDLRLQPGVLNIQKAQLIIAADNKEITYGEDVPEFSLRYEGFLEGEGVEDISLPALSTNAPATPDVGEYGIQLTGGNAKNYQITLQPGVLKVKKAALNIKANDVTMTYGAELPELSLSFMGFVNGDDASAITLPTIGTTASSSANVGDYPIELDEGAATNYEITLEEGTLAIKKAELLITADDKSFTYGGSAPVLTATYEGLVNDDTEEVVTGLELASEVNATTNAGIYPISGQNATANNYEIHYANGEMTIDKAELLVAVLNESVSYGAEVPNYQLSYAGFLNGDGIDDIEEPVATSTFGKGSPVGIYPIKLSGGTAANYFITLGEGSITVNKALLTARADDQSVIFGDEVPELTVTYEGFVNGDDVSDITAPAATTTATNNSGFGVYPITLSAGSAQNYQLTLNNGTLQIGKAVLIVTAQNKEMSYGDAVPDLTMTYDGFIDGEDENDIVPPFIFARVTSNSPAGEYPIELLGGLSNNYIFQFNNGILDVKKAPVTITANDQTITYGEDLPEFTVKYAGFVNGQDESVIAGLQITSDVDAAVSAGDYTISVSGGDADNYELTYVAGDLTVNKTPLIITAEDKIMGYGGEFPELTIDYDGFVNSETKADIDAPTLTTVATADSDAGVYDIILTGGASNNYELILNNGNLTIGRGVLRVTVIDEVMTYGDELPVFSATYEGLIGDDTDEAAAQNISFSSIATSASNVGDYEITATAGEFSNYDLQVTPGILTIGKATLNVTADAKQTTYGQAVPTLTRTYEGFKNGDDESDIVEPTVSTEATSNSVVGLYDIELAGGFSINYDLILNNGELEVGKAALDIIAQDRTITYGDALPSFTVAYKGFVNGEDESVVTGLSISSSAGDRPNSGVYDISPTDAEADNYDITFEPGTLTVNKAMLTVSAIDKSITYGEAIPDLEMSFSGFKYDDTESLVTGPQIITAAELGSDAGVYEVALLDGNAENYELNLVNGVLTIQKAPLHVTISNQTMTYGDDLPPFTATYSGWVNGDDELAASGLVYGPEATSASAVGTYDINYSSGVLTNYYLNVTQGLLTIDKAPLSIKAVDKELTYGEGAPPWTFEYSGFVNSDNEADIEIPTASAAVTPASPVGDYEISIAGGSAQNYEISLVKGNCEVVPAVLQVVASDAEMVYGDDLPTLSLVYAGFVNGEDASVLASKPELSTLASSQSSVGEYEITASGGTAENYDIQLEIGHLTVKPARLTVQAENLQMIYGEPVPTLILNFVGFKNDDDRSVLTVPVTTATTASASSDVGAYPVSLSGGAADNYDIDLQDGLVFVNKAPLFVFANNQTKEFGQNNPTLTIEYRTFKNGDTAADITPPSISTSATWYSPIGDYDIRLIGGTAQNYELILQNGILTIVKARQVITFSLEGLEMLPNITFELPGTSDSGLPLVYTSSDESILSIEGNTATSHNSGTVSITASQPGNENYEAAIPVIETLTVQSLIGLTEEELDIVYPNPAAEFFRVKEPVQVIEIFDQQGIRVKRFEGEFDQYVISDLKRGIYSAFFYKDGKVGMSRIIIWR